MITFKFETIFSLNYIPISVIVLFQNEPWSGAVVAVTPKGEYGAASVGFTNFQICVRTQLLGDSVQVIPIPSMSLS